MSEFKRFKTYQYPHIKQKRLILDLYPHVNTKSIEYMTGISRSAVYANTKYAGLPIIRNNEPGIYD